MQVSNSLKVVSILNTFCYVEFIEYLDNLKTISYLSFVINHLTQNIELSIFI